MKIATISSKNQITLPVSMLRSLSLKPKARVLIDMLQTDDESGIRIRQAPKSLTEELAGFGTETFKKLGGGEKYLAKLRKEWD